MAENDELDLDALDEEINNTNKVEGRIKDLSGKVKQASEERDAEAKARKEAEDALSASKKQVEFLSSFSEVTSKYPAAAEFKDQIQEKVLSGYDMDDAAVSILNREGRLSAPPVQKEIVAGGSATNTNLGGGKAPGEMTQEDRRNALLEAEKRGDISV